jgi:hypothetical protein
MNVSSLSSSGSWVFSAYESMTEEEKSKVEEILSRYDAEDFSAGDQQSMMEELKEAGIKPSRELFSMIKDSGFVTAPPPPPSSASILMEAQTGKDDYIFGSVPSSSSNDFSSLLEQYQSGELNEEELREKMQKLLPAFSASTSGKLFKIEA